MKTTLLLATLALSACATSTPAPLVQAVAVPVTCPAPTLPAKPRLPVQDLTPGATADSVIRAYAESLRLCAAYSRALEITLSGYQK